MLDLYDSFTTKGSKVALRAQKTMVLHRAQGCERVAAACLPPHDHAAVDAAPGTHFVDDAL